MRIEKKRRPLEPEIKAMVVNYLRDKGKLDQETVAINEFTVGGYSRRVDLVLADPKYLIAFEIKSEADSLYRLDGQTKKYLEYFDKVVIVAASKHVKNIMETVPKHVAVWEVCDQKLKIKQRGKTIPIADKEKLIDLMKANELLKLSNKLSLSPKSKNRHSTKLALQNVPLDTLKKATLQHIQERFHMTSSLFWRHISTNVALPEHIELLSPYKEERQSQRAEKAGKESLWKNWSTVLAEDQHLIAMLQEQSKQAFGCPPKHIQRLLAA